MKTDGKVIIYDTNHLKDRSGVNNAAYTNYYRNLAVSIRALDLNLKPKDRAVLNQQIDALVEDSLSKPLPPL